VQVEPWFNLPHLIQVASCCLFNLVTVVFYHYNCKNIYGKKKTNRTSVLEDFMTAASDAVAKSTSIWEAASQYEINRHTWIDSVTERPQ